MGSGGEGLCANVALPSTPLKIYGGWLNSWPPKNFGVSKI